MRLPLLVVAMASVATVAAAQDPVDAPTFDWSGTVSPGATVHLDVGDGDVRVTAAADDRMTVHGERTHGSSMVFQAVTEGQNVTICAFRRGGRCDIAGAHGHFHITVVSFSRRSASATLTVALPPGVALVAHSGDGTIEVRGAGAGVTAESGDGDIRIAESSGAVRAHTSDGTIHIDRVLGSVYARTADGKVFVTDARGPVEASTADGDVEVRLAAGDTVSRVKAHSGNGTVTVYVSTTFAGEVDARTSDGKIDSELPLPITGRMNPSHIHASVGTNGAGRLELDTSDGNVHLKKL